MLTLFPTEIEYELLFVCICANVNNLKYVAMDRICNNEISIARSEKQNDQLKNLDPMLCVYLNTEHTKYLTLWPYVPVPFYFPISIQFEVHSTIYTRYVDSIVTV